MNKILKIVLTCLTVLLVCVIMYLYSCRIVNTTKVKCNLGKFVSLTPIVTSFNERIKSVVATDTGVFTITGHYSGIYGEDVNISCSRILKK